MLYCCEYIFYHQKQKISNIDTNFTKKYMLNKCHSTDYFCYMKKMGNFFFGQNVLTVKVRIYFSLCNYPNNVILPPLPGTSCGIIILMYENSKLSITSCGIF